MKRRKKCRQCGKLVHRNSKNEYYCSEKCVRAAVKANNLPGNKERIEKERKGPNKPPTSKNPIILADAVAIPFETQELPLNPTEEQTRAKMMEDLINCGRCVSEVTAEGIRRIDPHSDEVLVAMANAASGGNTQTELYNSEEAKRIWDEAKADGRVMEYPAEPSPWQGAPPENTMAFYLKYGVWFKKDLP